MGAFRPYLSHVDSFDEAVGQVIERIRSGYYAGQRDVAGAAPPLSPEDVAAAARELGIPWRRGTVRAIETGTRKLWASEFVLLPEIFRRAWARRDFAGHPQLSEFAPEVSFAVGNVDISGAQLSQLLRGRPMSPRAIRQLPPEERRPNNSARLQPRRSLPLGDLPPGLNFERLGREAQGDAEIKLARKLDVNPEAIVIAAHTLWGATLTDKRDEKLAEAGWAHEGSMAQRRGRITLRLGEELAEQARSVQRLLTDVSDTGGTSPTK